MPIDPYAFQNAYETQQAGSLRNRINQQNVAQQGLENQRYDAELAAQQQQQSAKDAAAKEAAQQKLLIEQISPFAQRILQQPKPREAFLMAISNPQVRQVFEQAGFDSNDFDPNDPELEQDLQSIAMLSAAPKEAAVAPEALETTVGPDGKPVLTPRSKAAGMTPYYKPDAADGGFNLSAGQTRYGPDGKVIATAPNKPTQADTFDVGTKLRNEYNQQSKEFRGVADSYQRIVDSASDPSAAGDLALIFNYMKVLDPGSTVREGEFATAQQATSVPGRVLSMYNKILTGERLNPAQREDFVGRATKLYKGQENRFKSSVYDRYVALAKQNGISPDDVVVDVNAQARQQAPAAQPTGGWGQAVVVQ